MLVPPAAIKASRHQCCHHIPANQDPTAESWLPVAALTSLSNKTCTQLVVASAICQIDQHANASSGRYVKHITTIRPSRCLSACTTMSNDMRVKALSAKMLCSSHMGTAANGANDCCDDWSLCSDLTHYTRRAHRRHVGMLQLQPVYFPATALGIWPALACCIATFAARDAQ